MLNINKLLSKKTWTGEEVGKALLASLVHDAKNYVYKPGAEYKPLFSQAEYARMVKAITGAKNIKEYNVYVNLYNALKEAYNRVMLYPQLFYHGYYRFLSIVSLYRAGEEALDIISITPLIVTPAQYERLKKETVEELESRKESLASLIISTAQYFYHPGEDEAPAKVREALEALGDQLITRERVLREHKIDLQHCYYWELPDGRRSDQMDPKAWKKAEEEHYLKAHVYIDEGEKQDAETTKAHFTQERLFTAQKIFFEGMEGIRNAWERSHPGAAFPKFTEAQQREMLEALENIASIHTIDKEQTQQRTLPPISYIAAENFIVNEVLDPITSTIGLKCHETEGYPETTKNAIMETIAYCYYPVSPKGTAEDKKMFKEFTEDYPELYKAVYAYIKSKIPAAKKIPAAQYTKPFITWGELAKKNFTEYKQLTEGSKYNIVAYLWKDVDLQEGAYMKVQKLYHAGPAIKAPVSPLEIDKNGDYMETDPLKHFDKLGDLPGDESTLTQLNMLRGHLIARGYSYIYAFNTLVDILGRVYGTGIEGMDALKFNVVEVMESQIEAVTRLLIFLYARAFGGPKERAYKREVIKKYLYPVDLEALRPTQEAIETLEARLLYHGLDDTAKDILKNLDPLINELVPDAGKGA